ncbi:hypothetical protein Tco_0321147 [Tanacetum coccineum]
MNRACVVPEVLNQYGMGHYGQATLHSKAKETDVAYLQQQLQIAQEEEAGNIKQLKLEFYNDMQQKIKRLQAQLGDIKGKSKDTPCVLDTLDPLFQKLQNENVSEQKDTTKGTSVNTQFSKQSILGNPPSSSESKLYSVTAFPKSMVIPNVGESNALSKPVTSNLAPSSRESTIVNNERVIAPGIFKINPFKAPRADNFVPNKHVKLSVRTKPITVSQPHVITKNDVNSKTNGFSPKDSKSTTRTRRPLPRNNTKNDKVPSKSKSSRLSNNLKKIEENHRNLLSSSNRKHMSSEYNNIKLVIRNAKFEVVCAMCKQCLITGNHDVCVLNYVNDMNSRALNKKQKANVSKIANQTKHKAQVWKPKNVRSKERLASPKPNSPRSCLRWSPTSRMFDLKSSKVYSVICLMNNSNGENQVVSKFSDVNTVDAFDKRQQQQDSTSSASTLATTISADGNFDL